MSDVMKTLGLTQLEKALPVLSKQARQQKMTYETFLQRADAEVEGRNLRAAQGRIQAAPLPVTKTLESFDFSFQPSISERLVRELADLSFVTDRHECDFSGTPGGWENTSLHRACGQGLGGRAFGCLPRSRNSQRPLRRPPIPAWCVSGFAATPPLVFSLLMRSAIHG